MLLLLHNLYQLSSYAMEYFLLLTGQKVNPVGLRLGINRGWDSVWYAKKKDFGNYLIEDFKIREYIKKNVIGNATVITAMVPLANMFGYINNLRSMSQGRAQYSMFFDHYSKVPQNVQDEVTKKIAG